MKRIQILAVMVAVFVAACGGDDDGVNPGADANPNAADADPSAPDADPNAPDAGAFITLIDSDWTLSPGTEKYQCARLTVSEDIYIAEFDAIGPLGTHHTVLTVGEPNGADGSFPCDTGTNADAMIYGSGVGTNPIKFPSGVAMKVAAGQQLLINLHLFNTSDQELTGTSGTLARLVPASAVQNEAEVILAGKTFTLSVPPGPSTSTGTCAMNGDVTLFAVGPHMHQMGTHLKVTANSSTAGSQVIHDAAYNFFEQRVEVMSQSVAMSQGDTVQIECTYNNTSSSTIAFGESSNEEMCFAGIYRYPAFGGDFGIICAQN
jgi:hypothetical protein